MASWLLADLAVALHLIGLVTLALFGRNGFSLVSFGGALVMAGPWIFTSNSIPRLRYMANSGSTPRHRGDSASAPTGRVQ
jgi:hypothetical protein